MTTKEAVIIAGNVVLAAVGILLFVEGKMPLEQLGLMLTSIGFPSAGVLLKLKADGPAAVLLFVSGAFSVATALAACGAAQRQQLRDGLTVVDRSCDVVESISGDGKVNKVCATFEDVTTAAEALLDHASDAAATDANP